MANLPQYHLTYDRAQGDWVLRRAGADRATRRFPSKDAATAGGVLEAAVGAEGGSVRIHLQNGQFEEERTYPGSRDPRSSRG